MTRSGVSLMSAVWMVTFIAYMAVERQLIPTRFSRDLIPSWIHWVITRACIDFRIDHGRIRLDMNNTDICEGATGWSSVAKTAPSLWHRSDSAPFRVSETCGVIYMINDTFVRFGFARGGAGIPLITTAGRIGESTLLQPGQRLDAPGRTHQPASGFDRLASVSGLCPLAGGLNHPGSPSSITCNNMVA